MFKDFRVIPVLETAHLSTIHNKKIFYLLSCDDLLCILKQIAEILLKTFHTAT